MRQPSKAHHRAIPGLAFGGALAFAAALGGCLGYDGEIARGYQVDEETLSQVKIGATTKQQALALLGTP